MTASAMTLSWLSQEQSRAVKRFVSSKEAALPQTGPNFPGPAFPSRSDPPRENGGAGCLPVPRRCAVCYFCPWLQALQQIVICVVGFDLSQKCLVLSLPATHCGKRQLGAAFSLSCNIRVHGRDC